MQCEQEKMEHFVWVWDCKEREVPLQPKLFILDMFSNDPV